MGKEVVRIIQSKNKKNMKTLTQKKRYQIGSQPGMSTSRTEGRRWQKRARKWRRNRLGK